MVLFQLRANLLHMLYIMPVLKIIHISISILGTGYSKLASPKTTFRSIFSQAKEYYWIFLTFNRETGISFLHFRLILARRDFYYDE